MSTPEGWENVGEREPRTGEDEDARARAADADDSLAPGSMPGGPEYAEEASEGGEDDPRGTPAD